VPPILIGTKSQTIRSDRKRLHVKPGQDLQLYTAMRTKECRKIGDAVCKHVLPIVIELDGPVIVIEGFTYHSGGALDQFAQNDGFAHWPDMLAFWTESHPDMTTFKGVLIRWRDFVPAMKDGSATDN
jgi:hypothetical protein